jgi:hypothetical protein
LDRIEVTRADNAEMSIPAFTPGTAATIKVCETKIKENKTSFSEIRITDRAGNILLCDPVIAVVGPGRHHFGGLHQTVHKLLLRNGNPGLRRVELRVNGRRLVTRALRPGGALRLDLARAMRPGPVNRVRVRAHGAANGSATLVISDQVA